MIMKKILLSIIFGISSLLFFSSCHKVTTEGMTGITYYASIVLNGDEEIVVQKGSVYVDEGCYAELDGKDISSEVKCVNTVNAAVSGIYSVTYSYTNKDGFSSSTSRTVYVLDKTDPLEGIYVTNPASFRNYSGTIKKFGGDAFSQLIFKNDKGLYEVQDFMGGYYWIGQTYGLDYAAGGTFSLSGSTITLVSSFVPGWGDSLDYLKDASFDGKTIKWTAGYGKGKMFFEVTLDKQ